MTETEKTNLPAPIVEAGITAEHYQALRDVVFPNAKDPQVIAAAFQYCKARNLDIMKNTVNIVPVWDSSAKGGKGGMVERVWPSIAEIRITAHRTGQYLGCSPVVFGKKVKSKFGGKTDYHGKSTPEEIITHPEWCEVTVYRNVNGQRGEFPCRVYWEEAVNIVNGTGLPNSQWLRRKRGQLEKCAEAAALRKAFPEELGNMITAEEMEGQELFNNKSTPSERSGAKSPTDNFEARVAAETKPAKEEPETNVVDADFTEVDDDAWDGCIYTLPKKKTGKPVEAVNDLNESFPENILQHFLEECGQYKTQDKRRDMLSYNIPLLQWLKAGGNEDIIAQIHQFIEAGNE